MIKEIFCHKGTCFELSERRIPSFDELFEENNIVQRIEKDIWRKNFYGTDG